MALQRAGLREIRSLADLRLLLGKPASILCLGNGPSSESASVPAEDACLFRVNWIWRERKFLTEPHVIFTADPDLPEADRRAILAFPTDEDALHILTDYCRAGRRPAAWFAVPNLLALPECTAYPTNGALMIAVAAALDPARLAIAGIDLYRHPEGKYPGATEEPNEYAPIHDPAVDLAVIASALARYRGALTLLSDNLRNALAK